MDLPLPPPASPEPPAISPNASGVQNRPRLIQLDFLRGIAILMVLAAHPPVPGTRAGFLSPLTAKLEFFGWTGVDLFFVLSGFLIGGLLFKELHTHGSLSLTRFYIRRGFRIWPAYYLCLLVVVLIVLARTHGDLGRTAHITYANFLHVQNYVPDPERPLGQSWTLAVEEHFYVLLPLAIWLIWKYRRRGVGTLPAVPILAGVLSVGCTVGRWIAFHRPHLNFFATHFRMDSLFFGVLLAYLSHFEPEKFYRLAKSRRALGAACMVLLGPMFFYQRETSVFMWSLGLTMLYGGYGALLILAVGTHPGHGWAGRALNGSVARGVAWIGMYSYTIYLWFGILGARPTEAVFRHVRIADPALNWLGQFLTYVGLSVLGGAVMAKLVDAHALRLRDKLFPARADSLA